MSKKNRKATDTKLKGGPRFIKFNPLQQNYLSEVRVRQVKEWGEALESVYRNLGIMEKIKEAPPGTYRLRQNDLSGLDFIPVLPPPPPIDEEEEKKKAEELKKIEEEAKSKKPH